MTKSAVALGIVAIAAAVLISIVVLAMPPSRPATSPTAPAAFGWLHLRSDEPLPVAVQLRYRIGETALPDGDAFGADGYVGVDREVPVGELRVEAGDIRCEGTVQTVANAEVDAFITFRDGTCSVVSVGSHGRADPEHFESWTGIIVMVTGDSEVLVRSLDDPSVEPVRSAPDEAGDVRFDLEPGRYEAAVELRGEVLKTEQIEIGRNRAWALNLRVLDPTVPVDCGEIAPIICETAVATAYGLDLGILADTVVTAVAVAPTDLRSCGEGFDPEWDVTFSVEGPGEITVSVGRVGDRLDICTY